MSPERRQVPGSITLTFEFPSNGKKSSIASYRSSDPLVFSAALWPNSVLKADFEPPFVTGEVVPLRGACRRPRRGEHTRPCRRQGDPSLLLVARVP